MGLSRRPKGMHTILPPLCELVILAAWGTGGLPGTGESAADAGALVRALASPSFAEREAATRKLDRMGARALPFLEAGLQDENLEVRRRAEGLREKILQRDDRRRYLVPQPVAWRFRGLSPAEILERLPISLRDEILVDPTRFPSWREGRTDYASQGKGLWQAWQELTGAVGAFEPLVPPPGKWARDVDLAAVRERLTTGFRPQIEWRAGPAGPIVADVRHTVRVRGLAVPLKTISGKKPEEFLLLLEIRPEPLLAWRGVQEATVDRLADGQGRIVPMPAGRATRRLPLKEKAGSPAGPEAEPGAVSLALSLPRPQEGNTASVEGRVVVHLVRNEVLLRAGDPRRSVGKFLEGVNGLKLKVVEALMEDCGDLTLRLRLENVRGLTDQHGGPRVVRVRPGFLAVLGPADLAAQSIQVLDDQERPLPRVRHKGSSEGEALDLTLTFQPTGREKDLRLRVEMPLARSVAVPFRLEELRLPGEK